MTDAELKTPRVETLYERLLARILSDEFRAGQRLPAERALADEYKTNRNTLREAIRRLEQARLVSIRQGRGVTVLDFRRTASVDLLGAFLEYGSDPLEKAALVLDLLQPRERLLEEVVRAAAQRATPSDLDAIRKTIEQVRAAEANRSLTGMAAAQNAWVESLLDAGHNIPMRWAANPLLAALGEVLSRRPDLLVFEPSFADAAAAAEAALRVGDADRAVECVRAYYGETDERLRALLAGLPTPESVGEPIGD